MKPPQLAWYRLRWPREVQLQRLEMLSLLLAGTAGTPVVVETIGQAGRVEHRLGLPANRASAVVAQFHTSTPEIDINALAERQALDAGRALELRPTAARRLLRIDQTSLISRALLTVLSHTARDELLLLQWQLVSVSSTGVIAEPLALTTLLSGGHELDAAARADLKIKRSLPVWRAIGHVAVRAATRTREQMLLREVMAAFRLVDAPGVRLLARRCAASRVERPGHSWGAPFRLNTAELIAVSGWPVGSTADLAVDRISARTLRPAKAIPQIGRVVGISTAPGREWPIAIEALDGLRHLHLLGPTGVGKSTVLLNLIVHDLAAGRGVVVIEPKGDLVRDVLERIPAARLDDVVLLDPADPTPVGLNPLAADGRPPGLVADELLGMFRRMYESSWGPRTNDILGASLLTLARTPGMSLPGLPALLSDAGFRHRTVSKLDDPLGLTPFWLTFEGWSEAERLAAVAPSMNRIRPFLLRPQLRAVLGQSRPRFELSQVFTERKILLVNLSKGVIGGEAASLLGSLLLSQLWAAALRRSTIPQKQRHPVFVYVDEVQDYLHLTTDLGDALVQARALGVGFVVAHQHLAQLDSATRAAVLTNARSRICFQLPADDARVLASPPLTADDLRELPAFEVYAQLVADGAVQPWCSARTLPAPAITSNPDQVRSRSRRNYGVEQAAVDAELERLLGGRRFDTDDLAPRRRQNRGAT
jgi:hypothetical protein